MEGFSGMNDIGAVVEADRAHVWHHLSQHKQYETVDPRVIVEGKGMRVWDAKGKEHLRRGLGRGLDGQRRLWPRKHRQCRARPADQAELFRRFARARSPARCSAKKLIEKMPGMTRVYYSNSGSEANEKVYKMVRQISHRHHGGKKWKILYRDRDYHGTTIGPGLCRSGPARHAVRAVPGRLRARAALP
jgi:taurine-pyruvate aminotransferase